MQASNAPTKIQTPFADSGDKQTIPVASQIGITDGRASFTDGFPPLTRTPVVAGGVPPFGTDMNGILYDITAIQQWLSAGGRFVYDSAFAAAIGGYPKGAVLQKADGSGSWLCTAENNSTNPDTGGANWQDFSGGRLLNVQIFATAGSFTYTPTAGIKSAVVEVQGGGGAGGSCAVTSTGQVSSGGGGGAGGRSMSRIASPSSQTVTVGAGGAPAASGANAGGNGGSSSFGALLSATGGNGGAGGAAATPPGLIVGGLAGTATGGNILNTPGEFGGCSSNLSTANAVSGMGGSSYYGGGAAPRGAGSPGVGLAASSPGSGGSGALTLASGSGFAGGAGAPGIVIVWEYA